LNDFDLKKRQVLERVDIVALISEHVRLKRIGRRWVGLCPFHTEKTPSFTVSPDLAIFKCFGCGKGGDVFSFVAFRENISFGEAFRLLADRAGVELSERTNGSASEPGRRDISKVNEWGVRYFQSLLRHHSVGAFGREYLARRGFTDASIDQFEIGLAAGSDTALIEAAKRNNVALPLLIAADLARTGDGNRPYDTFRDRIIFPIRDATKRVIGFGGRTLVDDRAKYLNTRQTALFDKGTSLYGINKAREVIGQRGRAIVVEGYTDCIAAHQAGFTETVATLGTALTESHIHLLRRYGDSVILLFDGDSAGEAAADRAIRIAFPRCMSAQLARIPDGADPADLLQQQGAKAFSDVLNRAVDALEFKWFATRTRFAADGSEAARRDAVMDFLQVVAEAVGTAAVDAIERGLLVNRVAHLLQMDQRSVDRLLTRLTSRTVRSSGAVASASVPSRRPPVAVDSEQAAWTNVLEVLINEPGLWGRVAEFPDCDRIADPCLRRIGRSIVRLAETCGEFRMVDLQATCIESEDAQRLGELAQKGASRGNYEKTLTVALERIRGAINGRRREVLDAISADAIGDRPNALATMGEAVRQHRHFAPKRLLRQAPTDWSPENGSQSVTG